MHDRNIHGSIMTNNGGDRMKELIYTPTMRCNLRCEHCGQDHLAFGREGELSCASVAESLLSSDVFNHLEHGHQEARIQES